MNGTKFNVLVVDDNEEFVNDIIMFLEKNYNCLSAYSADDAINISHEIRPDAILLDISLSESANDEQGFDVLTSVKSILPHTAVIMVSKHDTEEKIDRAIQLGADFYLPKKTGAVDLKRAIAFTLQKCFLAKSHSMLLQQQDELVYQSNEMSELMEEARAIASTNAKVLIVGETGTGKRLVAEFIHRHSPRAKHPFGTVNALSLDPNLISSELFGHKRGAFTGAVEDRIGKLENCNRGTVFLDEIGDYSLEVQTKLLDFLDRGIIQRLGSNTEKKLDVRIVAATNKNLEKLIEDKKFRDDLYYRLKVKTLYIPPLRERIGDIEIIAQYFIQKFSIENHKFLIRLEKVAFKVFEQYAWPGNVRELRHFIEGLCIRSEKNLYTNDDILRMLDEWDRGSSEEVMPIKYDDALRYFKRNYCEHMLKKSRGNVSKAASLAGIQRESLHRIIKNLDISLDGYR
jgi:DNA-binding NtrC family response regulator